jgi:putative oxidoreductase
MDAGLLLIRLIVGLLLAGHGAKKLFGWFDGPGLAGTSASFESLGYRHARTMAAVAGMTELVAGGALAAGALTPLAAAGIIGLMINAAVAAHGTNGLWGENGGYEYPLVLATVAVTVAATGPGAWSVDTLLGWSVSGVAWALGAVVLGAVSALAVLATRRIVSTEPAAEGRYYDSYGAFSELQGKPLLK